MSSVTRLTIALAVIMVEISDDVHMLLPVLVAIMVAKWVADAATHSLYHALLEVKCAPFLVGWLTRCGLGVVESSYFIIFAVPRAAGGQVCVCVSFLVRVACCVSCLHMVWALECGV